MPFSLGLWILFKNQIIPRTQGVKFLSNRKHVWSINQSVFGRFFQVMGVGNCHFDTVSVGLHWVAPDIVPEGNQCEALPCMQTIK
jgi:hypothetical protein